VLRWLVISFSYIYFKLFHWVEYIDINNIPKEGAAILYANHISNADPLVLVCNIKRMVYFMAKEELFKTKIQREFWSRTGVFPVKRGTGDIGAIKKSLEKLKNEEMLCMFPEGTRRLGDNHPEPKPGLALIAIKAKCIVIPAAISAPPKLFKRIKVKYGKPIDLSEYYGKHLSMDNYTEISKKLMEEVEKLKEGN